MDFQIKYELFTNRNEFQKGDIVVYNWKAHLAIKSAIVDKTTPMIISEIMYKDNSGLEFSNGDSCDSFWVRKIRFYEDTNTSILK